MQLEEARKQGIEVVRAARARGGNLPIEVTSFRGRTREIAELAHLLDEAPLLTLTGTGGCGKTRLALRLAAETANRFPDGVYLVELSSVSDPSLVPFVVATVLGLKEEGKSQIHENLALALAHRRLLIILDNCEHLIGACAKLSEAIVHACLRTRILATSREPLRAEGEVTYRVPSLAVPSQSDSSSPEALRRVESVALFLDRARSKQPNFTLTSSNARTIAEICRRLDGLPLAIELSAGLVPMFAPEQIASRLDDSLSLLGGGNRTTPRQETMRATLDWSYDLLDDRERSLLRRLSVFSEGFDLEAVEAICSDDPAGRGSLQAVLASLVGKSLVAVITTEGTARYRLAEPVRQYAWERLIACGEEEDLRGRHARFYSSMAVAAEPWLMSGQRAEWMMRLSNSLPNLRRAMEWSIEDPSREERVNPGLATAAALGWYWNNLGQSGEGWRWLETMLAASAASSPDARMKAVYMSGELAWLLGKYDVALVRLQEAERFWRERGERRWLAYALQALATVTGDPADRVEEALAIFSEIGDAWGLALAEFSSGFQGFTRLEPRKAREARARMERALVKFRRLGDDWFCAQVLNGMGDLARIDGNTSEAAACYEESLALLRKLGIQGIVPSLLHNLGYVALRQGNPRRALRSFRESLALFARQWDQRGVAECLEGMAGALVALGQPERAARLLGAAEAMLARAGVERWMANEADYAGAVDGVRVALGDERLTAAWAAGRQMPVEQVMAEAAPEDRSDEPLSGQPSPGAGLTPREREIVALIGRGLTNRQIAEELVITEGTARLHVQHVLRKLGFTSRAHVAAWAVAQQLAPVPEPDLWA